MKNDIIIIDASNEYAFHLDKLIERSKNEIFTWFNKPNEDCKVKIFLYKDLNHLVSGLKARGFKDYPDYMCACMIDEDCQNNISRSINLFDPTTSLSNFTKKEYDYIVYHELIHYITNYLFGSLPEWLTEGIAKYLDNSYKEDLTNLMSIINNYKIPSLAVMYGNNFVKKINNQIIYDGYDLSYLLIRYLLTIYDKNKFISLLENKNISNAYFDQLLKEAINYFNSVYSKENTIKKSKI